MNTKFCSIFVRLRHMLVEFSGTLRILKVRDWVLSFVPESMAANPQAATIHERCRVAPHAAAELVAEQYLSLTFFDMRWLNFHPLPILFFYKFSCSKTHFFETVVPNVKKSLSQALKHFLPLAGNLLCPLESGSGMPVFRYVLGDSVSVTVAEASEASDFNYLTGNFPRDCDRFRAFASDLPEWVVESESSFKKMPLFSVQITLFPDSGICMAFCSHHAIADASGLSGFLNTWSSIAKLGGNDEFLTANDNLLPIFDRSLIKDPTGVVDVFWNQQKLFKKDQSRSRTSNFPKNKVRATFILRENEIQKLKNSALAKNPALLHLSSFNVAAAYVWSCLAKSAAETGEEVDDNEPKFFAFPVEIRSRLNPPVPAKYFGNCVRMVSTGSTHKELKGKDGFFTAVKLIGDVISEKIDNTAEILKGIENYVSEIGALMKKGSFGVAGSPKFDFYRVDFGWGKPNKIELVWIVEDGSMSLLKSREFEGGLEIGLALPKLKMDAFANIFFHGLNNMGKIHLARL